jgi:glucose-1-phosphate cytidylyltransferase
MAYKHEGFWRSMDTLKDRQILEDLVEHGKMPWRMGQPAKLQEMIVV